MVGIIVGSIAMFAVGSVWFTVLFGKLWSRLMNFSPEAGEKMKAEGMAGKMVIMFIANVLSVWVLSYFLSQIVVLSYTDFLIAVFVIWLGFTLPSLVNTYLWEGKSLKLVAINAGGSVAMFIAGSLAVYLLK